MSGNLATRSALLRKRTLSLYEALQEQDLPADGPEIERQVERQREAFNEFSRNCDPGLSLDPATRRNIDEVLQLEARIVELASRGQDALLVQARSVAKRRDQAQAFHSKVQEPPRFVAHRV